MESPNRPAKRNSSMDKSDCEDLPDLEQNHSNPIGTVETLGDPLSRLGLEQPQTSRDLGLLAIIATGWNICNSWSAISATMALSLASGGPVTLIYGIVLIFVLGGACALTMAEIASVYPTAGGQYHWTSILANESISRPLSYCCGVLNLLGWIATTAGFIVTLPIMIFALVSFWNPGFAPETWHVFLVYQGVNVFFTLYNIYLAKRTVWLQDFGFFLSLTFFFVITITCLAKSDQKQTSTFVWTTFVNDSGWSSPGIVFLTGLVNPNFIFSGLDGAIHLAEEATHPAVAIPRALLSTVVIGFVTSLAFAVAMTYSYHDLSAVLASPMPILEIWHQATSSQALATLFLLILCIGNCFAVAGAQQTASRLTWAFARDDALLLSAKLRQVSPRWDVPVAALWGNAACVFALGFVYLASSTAFNALVSTGLILAQLSFAIPAALVLYLRFAGGEAMEAKLPASRGFKLPVVVGVVANVLTVVLGVVALVFYDFPVVLPVTAGNMNYTCAVIGVMALLSVANWFGHANRHYSGPRLEGI